MSNISILSIWHTHLLTCVSSTTFSILTKMKSSPCADLDIPIGLQESETPRISRQSAHDGGKVVSPTHLSPLRTGIYYWNTFQLNAQSNPVAQCGQKD